MSASLSIFRPPLYSLIGDSKSCGKASSTPSARYYVELARAGLGRDDVSHGVPSMGTAYGAGENRIPLLEGFAFMRGVLPGAVDGYK